MAKLKQVLVERLRLPDERPSGLDSRTTARIIKYMSRGQVLVFKATRGRVGSRWRVGAGMSKPVATLLLEHIGRTSGRTFTTPLLYLEDGADVVVVASQGGLPSNPQWYRNLLATPDTAVWVRGRGRVAVRAHEASETERAELWPRLVELYADFAKYDSWTDRQIPVLILQPR